jgi:Mn-dependent DtxR family transcriptional regulator
VLWRNGPVLTSTEIADHLNTARDSLSPRTVELERAGLIEYVGQRMCANQSAGRQRKMQAFRLSAAGKELCRVLFAR